MRSYTIIIIALLSILNATWSQMQISLDSPTDPQALSAGQAGHYTFVVPANFSTGKDYLIFDVIGTEDSAYDPDIFISNVLSFFFKYILENFFPV